LGGEPADLDDDLRERLLDEVLRSVAGASPGGSGDLFATVTLDRPSSRPVTALADIAGVLAAHRP